MDLFPNNGVRSVQSEIEFVDLSKVLLIFNSSIGASIDDMDDYVQQKGLADHRIGFNFGVQNAAIGAADLDNSAVIECRTAPYKHQSFVDAVANYITDNAIQAVILSTYTPPTVIPITGGAAGYPLAAYAGAALYWQANGMSAAPPDAVEFGTTKKWMTRAQTLLLRPHGRIGCPDVTSTLIAEVPLRTGVEVDPSEGAPWHVYAVPSSDPATELFAKSPRFTGTNGVHYWIRNNCFGYLSPGFVSQYTWAKSAESWGGTSQNTNGPDTEAWVKSYTSICRGWVRYEGVLPQTEPINILVSNLTRAKIHWRFRAPTKAGGVGRAALHRGNWLWDLYFDDRPRPDPSFTEDIAALTNILINQYDVDADLAYGGNSRDNATEVTLGGQQWRMAVHTADYVRGNAIELWPPSFAGLNNDWITIGTRDLTTDFLAVILDLVDLGYISPSHYLVSMQAGLEGIAYDDFQTLGFYTALNDEPDGLY